MSSMDDDAEYYSHMQQSAIDNAALYYQSAAALGLKPVTALGGYAEDFMFFIKIGKKCHYFYGALTPFNSITSYCIANDKYLTNRMLYEAGIPVPDSICINRDEFRNNSDILKTVKYPVVVKPAEGSSLGRNVLCGIQNEMQLLTQMEMCFENYFSLCIETYHGGLQEYRILVYNNKVIDVLLRVPAHVIADGKHTIEQLIEISNGERKAQNLAPILIDKECRMNLNQQKLTLDSIPEADCKIKLGSIPNPICGGTIISQDLKICRQNAELACRAASALDLNLVGFDMVCQDIAIPIEQSQGVFIEANHNPDIVIHEKPSVGKPTIVSIDILKRFMLRHPSCYPKLIYWLLKRLCRK